ncbi:MAG TPA: cytochrome c [Gemmataceae bacterium]|jgi:hypothetical protein|nr:cytochrome c [Gemmataceae bacterium]
MASSHIGRRCFLILLAPALLLAADAPPKGNKIKSEPQLEPVAKTVQLMRGINVPNFIALDRMLRHKAEVPEVWEMIGGHARLIAENGNLLLLRPPRKKGRDAWLELAARLRTKAKQLAEDAEARDYATSRADFKELANTCNRCHQKFDVSIRVHPFEVQPIRGTNRGALTGPKTLTPREPPPVTEPPPPRDPPQPPS